MENRGEAQTDSINNVVASIYKLLILHLRSQSQFLYM